MTVPNKQTSDIKAVASNTPLKHEGMAEPSVQLKVSLKLLLPLLA